MDEENSVTWALSSTAEQGRLERAFQNRSIDSGTPGFCDSAAFLREEQHNPRFLEAYARYIEVRTYSDVYLAEARSKIAVVAEAVCAAVEADGSLGRCVHASGMIGRMLDRLGVWNYVAKASLTIEFPADVDSEPLYFWPIDEGTFYAPHAIVVAPPFNIIDVTAWAQPYETDAQRAALPRMVLADILERAVWTPDDLANSDLRGYLEVHRIPFRRYLEEERPQMLDVMDALPARSVSHGATQLKYVIVAVGGIVEALENMHANMSLGGRTAMQIFNEDVVPHLQAS